MFFMRKYINVKCIRLSYHIFHLFVKSLIIEEKFNIFETFFIIFILFLQVEKGAKTNLDNFLSQKDVRPTKSLILLID